MSDGKRVVLTTLEQQKTSEKGAKKYTKTVRVRVSLPESNEDACPIFHYKDELTAAKKKTKEVTKEPVISHVPNGLDPFDEENDEDVRRIALEMEAKYGSGLAVGPKKKRKGRKDDYADIGAGYDENDSFIDNTDGYDEMIPHNVTTALGGFYINSGALEFKTDDEATSGISSESSGSEESSESDGEEDEGTTKKIKRKRALDSSDEEGVGGNSNQSTDGQKKENGDKPSISMQLAIKKKLFSTDKIQIKKRKLAQKHKTTVKELLRDKRHDIVNGTIDQTASKDASKENKKPMRLSSVVDAIDSVLGRVDEQLASPKIGSQDIDAADVKTSNGPSTKTTVPEYKDTNPPISDIPASEIVKLPENLPAEIQNIIEKLKSAAKDYTNGSKVKFFSGNVNILLLDLERKCKVLGRSSRSKVFEHLAPFVRCRKETLVKRAKNLVHEEENRKLHKTIENLKGQIARLMPDLINNHEKEYRRILQKKFSQEASTNEELKSLKAPRRRFPLHEELKRMLRDIVTFKKRCLLHEGAPKNALEELLTEYLKKHILTLWPEGWMSMAVLKKYCTALAIKTPDPKASSALASSQNKPHSQKPLPSSTSVKSASNNNLVITPINLTEKLGGVSCSSANSETSGKPLVSHDKYHDGIIQTIIKSPERSVDKQPSHKDNGVIVLSSKTHKEPVISQVIDLTDTPVKKTVIESSSKPSLTSNSNSMFPKKYPTVTDTVQEEVQRTIDSLLALQKKTEPKTEVSNTGMSVITYSKSYSGSSQDSERPKSSAVWNPNEFQKHLATTHTGSDVSKFNFYKKP